MGASHAAAPHVYGGVPHGAAAPYGGYAPAYGHAAVAGSVPAAAARRRRGALPRVGGEGHRQGRQMINYIQSTTGALLT